MDAEMVDRDMDDVEFQLDEQKAQIDLARKIARFAIESAESTYEARCALHLAFTVVRDLRYRPKEAKELVSSPAA